MGIKEFSKELEMRTLKFGVAVLQLSKRLPNTPEGKVVRNQLAKSGTSIGANYREANRARSKADFKNRIAICESEASETQYWLELIVEAGWIAQQDMLREYDESSQLLALFTSIGNK